MTTCFNPISMTLESTKLRRELKKKKTNQQKTKINHCQGFQGSDGQVNRKP